MIDECSQPKTFSIVLMAVSVIGLLYTVVSLFRLNIKMKREDIQYEKDMDRLRGKINGLRPREGLAIVPKDDK